MFGQDDKADEVTDTGTTIQPTEDAVQTDDAPVVPDTADANDTADTSNDNGSTADTTDDSTVAADSLAADASATESAPEDELEADTSGTPSLETSAPAETPAADSTPAPVADDALLDLKKDALGDLAPLIDHLDQTPEDHFKTTMMLIQATDDPSYIKTAYESAKKIPDDTARAQALLDIVNEINYFTQAHNSDDEDA